MQRSGFAPLEQGGRDFLVRDGAISSQDAVLIAALSEGSVGRGIHIIEADIMEERETLLDLMESARNRACVADLDWADKYAKSSAEGSSSFSSFASNLAEMFYFVDWRWTPALGPPRPSCTN